MHILVFFSNRAWEPPPLIDTNTSWQDASFLPETLSISECKRGFYMICTYLFFLVTVLGSLLLLLTLTRLGRRPHFCLKPFLFPSATRFNGTAPVGPVMNTRWCDVPRIRNMQNDVPLSPGRKVGADVV